jgi:putative protease
MGHKPELLSPAGDWDSLRAAVNNGADAVYLGLSEFNARAAAVNFTEGNIREAVAYAHLYGIKVYIALNTLIKNAEIPRFLELARAAVEAKADAFILQDLGAASILRRCFPGIVLHASTQAGVHNLYGARMAEKLGFRRVVLSRETKLDDIVDIRQNTSLELEFFVQGALCVAFSGNCYLAAREGGGSGNRGTCPQLCRLAYTAYDEKGPLGDGYLLSTSDLCLLNRLKDLTACGITSFKIEGRLRRPAYVAEATACYREAIDKGFPEENKERILRLKKVFSRGPYLEHAYLDCGTPEKIIYKEAQNHTGIPIGQVISARKFKDIFEITLKTKHKLSEGDGLKFFVNNREAGSLGVGNIVRGDGWYKVYGKACPPSGAKVHLITDSLSEQRALARERSIPLSFKVSARAGEPLRIEASFGGITAVEISGYVVPESQKSKTDAEEISTQIAKLGDTHFFCAEIQVEADNVFLPKSVLNEARRFVVKSMTERILYEAEKGLDVSIDKTEINKVLNETERCMAVSNVPGKVYRGEEDGGGVFEDGIAVIYPHSFDPQTVKMLADKVRARGLKPCLRLPVIANGCDLKRIDRSLEGAGVRSVLANNLYGFYYEEMGYEVLAGWGMNVCNRYSAETVRSLGAEKIIVSVELGPGEFCFDTNSYRFEGGGFPLMAFAHCPFKTLDGKDCTECTYRPGLKYYRGKRGYRIVRRSLSQCYFELVAAE